MTYIEPEPAPTDEELLAALAAADRRIAELESTTEEPSE